MPEVPTIAIHATSPYIEGFLKEVVRAAGLSIANEPESADMRLVHGASFPENMMHTPLLQLGGDKPLPEARYITAPVRAAKVIGVLTQMARKWAQWPEEIRIGEGVIHPREGVWILTGKEPVRLTEKEVALLVRLSTAGPEGVSRERLLADVWDYVDGVETHTLETHIYRLRQKIERDPASPDIVCTRERGYGLGLEKGTKD